MNIYSNLKQIEDYRNHSGISQSFLKMVLANNTRPFKETTPMLIGSLFDCLLTSPHIGDDLYCIGLQKRPSEAIKKFIDEQWQEAYQTFKLLSPETQFTGQLEDFKYDILMKAKIANYQRLWSDDAIWNSIKKDGEDYWNELIRCNGKTIVTQEEWKKCTNLAELTLNSHITGKYFISQTDVDKYFQLPIYWTIDNIECKGLLDLVILEPETKSIYYVDIKTTGVSSLEEWFSICRNKNYPFQMAWYKEGLKNHFKHFVDQEWSIKMRWMVIPTEGTFKPWIIPVSEEMLYLGKYGCTKVSSTWKLNKDVTTSQTYKGWLDAFQVYTDSKSYGLQDYDTFHFTLHGKLNNNQSNDLFFT